jgi:hypothetical protein
MVVELRCVAAGREDVAAKISSTSQPSGPFSSRPYSTLGAASRKSPGSIHQSPIIMEPSSTTTAVQQSCQCIGQIWFGAMRMSGMVRRQSSSGRPRVQIWLHVHPPICRVRLTMPSGPSLPPGAICDLVTPGATGS